jgi:hypothetical protein
LPLILKSNLDSFLLLDLRCIWCWKLMDINPDITFSQV